MSSPLNTFFKFFIDAINYSSSIGVSLTQPLASCFHAPLIVINTCLLLLLFKIIVFSLMSEVLLDCIGHRMQQM